MNALKVLSDTNNYNHSPPVWCGCLAHVVRVLSTNGADGMHHMCEGLTPLLYVEE